MLHINPKLFKPQPVDSHARNTISESTEQLLALLKTVPINNAGASGWTLVSETDKSVQVYWAPASSAANDEKVNGVMAASQWKLPQELSPDALFSFLTKDPKGFKVIDPIANKHGKRIELPAADVPAHTAAHYTWARASIPLIGDLPSMPKLLFMVLNAIYDHGDDKLFISLPTELTAEQQKESQMPQTPKEWQTEALNLWASYVHKVGNDWWLTSYCWLEFPTAGLIERFPPQVQAAIAQGVDNAQKTTTLQDFAMRLNKALFQGQVRSMRDPDYTHWMIAELEKMVALHQAQAGNTASAGGNAPVAAAVPLVVPA